MRRIKTVLSISAALFGLAIIATVPATADQVILDDLIVDGSICAGLDCVNGESFGFDTLRLKENNLRITAVDTSNSASFPTQDWQLTFNDSTNGGANKFAVQCTSPGSSTPFTVEGCAPNHSLYVDDGGRIGLGTSTPVVELHVVDGDTPTLRLEQDGSSGFTPQTWDVAGNETNFFVRDATNGSKLPFRIRPDAPSNSIFVDTDGDVGFGTSSPAEELHVRRTSGSTRLQVARDGAGDSARIELVTGGGSAFFDLCADCTLGTNQWRFTASPGATGNFAFQRVGFANSVMTFNGSTGAITIPGDLTVDGTFSNPSSKTFKQDFEPVDRSEVLAKLAQLPINKWTYKKDASQRRHIGPFTEDFEAAFGLGTASGTHIIPLDVQGVTIAALQGLNEKFEEKAAEVELLRTQLEELRALIESARD